MGDVNVTVQFGREKKAIAVTTDAKVEFLMQEMERETGVPQRSQKLIFKGKVLLPNMTITDAKLTNGAKIMLMSSKGGVQTAGQAAAARANEEKEKKLAHMASLMPNTGSTQKRPATTSSAEQLTPEQARAASWSKTGIVGLRDSSLMEVPSEALALGPSARVMDIGGNRLSSLPEALGSLSGLQRLRLSKNSLTFEGLPGPMLSALTNLTTLALDDNQLDRLPDALASLAQLRFLSAEQNVLVELPAGLGQLKKLEVLKLRGNRLPALCTELGDCEALGELDASDNKLTVIPESLAKLQRLKALLLDNNLVAKVPPIVLKECGALGTLSLHGNPITAEQLRETDGYSEYQERRITKYDKQIGMRTMMSRDGFDEGADAQEW
eukprot:CAMPEP_0118943650 /NCGR_PEP_ID=MMETSP1169-20130426/38757_1 /TAXON_ID=36882 /ORGANISM="Pyramimonas obovata, Strain CCMP722" /LENGTH=381 /DNA_ID=CAMNT_0006888953 /DNA_START=174 /DNA_END=1316 /DNA_ORIENTATION=+